jgi:hypothetical protein
MKPYIFIALVLLLAVFAHFHFTKKSIPIFQSPKVATAFQFPQNYTIGSWIWKSPTEISSDEMQSILDFSSQKGIDVLYIDISGYMDIFEKPNSPQKDTELKKFDDAAVTLMQKSHQKSIKIHALSGSVEWANDSHDYIPRQLLEYVITFNNSHPDSKFDGVQFDIEFYSQADFKKRQVEYSLNFLRLVEDLSKQKFSSGSNLELGFNLTVWLDNQNNNLSDIDWRGVKKPVAFHLYDLLGEYPNSYVVLLAYRNTVEGEEGSFAKSLNNLNYIKGNNLELKVIIGQETAPNKDQTITYAYKEAWEFEESSLKLLDLLRTYEFVKGIAIHDLQSYKALNEK